MRKAIITVNKNEIDVSSKSAILFGASSIAINVLGLCDIYCVKHIVDTDVDKWGTYCKINGDFLKIESPDILNSLNPNEYYICIFTRNYKDEIKNTIKRITNNDYIIVDNESSYFWSYDSIDELFEQDLYVRKKLLELRIVNTKEYVDEIKETLDSLKSEISWYQPFKKGHKLCVKCIGISGEYIICINSNENKVPSKEWHETMINPKCEIAIKEVIKKLQFMKDITLYANDKFYIQKFCSQNVDYSSLKIRKIVLEKISELHSKVFNLNGVNANPFVRYKLLYDSLNSEFRQKICKITSCIDLYKTLMLDRKYVLSHGDLHHGNIVFENDKCHFIDWEFLCYSYEYYDVCRFLFYSQIDEFSPDNNIYDQNMLDLYKMLPTYILFYKSDYNDNDIRDAYMMLFLCEGIELLLRLTRKQKNALELIPIIEKHYNLI